jgi:hypothetical protein
MIHPTAMRAHAVAALIEQHADLLPTVNAVGIPGNDTSVAYLNISDTAGAAELDALARIAAFHGTSVGGHTCRDYAYYSASVSIVGMHIVVSARVPVLRTDGTPIAITPEGTWTEYDSDELPGGWRWATALDKADEQAVTS